MAILVTGAAGFIGFHLTRRLLASGQEVIGLDNLNDYYPVQLKQDRLKCLTPHSKFSFHKIDLANQPAMEELFKRNRFETVVNLAAQAGVRYSLLNPHAYAGSNLTGFLNILEGCRHSKTPHLIFASSSSVYGLNQEMPFSEHQRADRPASLYAATKKANELMAHAYCHLYGLPTTGLRFFTVYGPWGRPDMAPFLFSKAITEGRPIDVFNHGEMRRDFTYIDDIVDGIVRVIEKPPQSKTGNTPESLPYRLYNIGNNKPEKLMDFIHVLERHFERKAKVNFLPMQPGDVVETYADISELNRDTGFEPTTGIEEGLARFVEWYCEYYKFDRKAAAA